MVHYRQDLLVQETPFIVVLELAIVLFHLKIKFSVNTELFQKKCGENSVIYCICKACKSHCNDATGIHQKQRKRLGAGA